jgi:hypothetical protein
MNKTTILNIAIFWLALVWFIGWWVAQNKASANEEIINLQKRNLELEQLIQEAKDNWHIAENAKAECVESWNNEQKKEQKKADAYREELQDNQDKLGLMLQSQLQ